MVKNFVFRRCTARHKRATDVSVLRVFGGPPRVEGICKASDSNHSRKNELSPPRRWLVVLFAIVVGVDEPTISIGLVKVYFDRTGLCGFAIIACY